MSIVGLGAMEGRGEVWGGEEEEEEEEEEERRFEGRRWECGLGRNEKASMGLLSAMAFEAL